LASSQEHNEVAIVVGVGARDGLGGAVTVRLAKEGFHVVALGRSVDKLEAIQKIVLEEGGSCTVFQLSSISASDAFSTSEIDREKMENEVIKAFDLAESLGSVRLVVQNQGPNMFPPTGMDMRDMEVSFVQFMWDVNMLISFLVGREAARRMIPEDEEDNEDFKSRGTVLFTGATGSIRGKPPFVAFAQAKAGVRMLAQSMAREYGPKGLHVVHLIVDGVVNGNRVNSLLEVEDLKGVNVDAYANQVVSLHKQHPSAWSHETELRPYAETW